MDLAATIRERLAALEPTSVDLEDESGRHAGHEGAKGGGRHFRLKIVSARFAGRPARERHRMVYAALGDLIGREIHALAIAARAPDEL
ncbi:MAG TPA: BolA family protein [Burkholderiales bacterium]|nr:BolA family protein [Burkholderiales bacterium]